MSKIYKGQDFEFEITLSRKEKPHRINDDAVVRASIFDSLGNQQSEWIVYPRNNGTDSDWQLGVLAETIPATETSGITSNSAELRINIVGNDEDRDGNLASDSYDRTWGFPGLLVS